jgi:hypothetical protein
VRIAPLLLLLFAAPALAGSPAESATPTEPVALSYPEIRMDPRFELLAMVQLLAGADTRFEGFFRHDIAYDHLAQERFSPYAGHPAVERFTELSRKGVSYLTFYEMMFRLGPPPGLEWHEALPDPLAAQLGGKERTEEFRLMLSDFSRAASFSAFYSETEDLRRSMIESVRGQAAGADVVAPLEAYLGMPVKARYTIVISPFAEPVLADAMRSAAPDGTPRLTSVYGPEFYHGKFGWRLNTRKGGLWTELTRVTLEGASQPYAERIDALARLFVPVAGVCETTWRACVERHVAFAVGARILELRGGSTGREMARRWPEKYRNFGLPYLGTMIDRLKEYEARAPRGTLAAFYPRLLDALEETAAKTPAPPFHGGIAEVLAAKGPAAFLLPARLSPEVLAGVERLRRRWPGALELAGARAGGADLKGRTIVVVGTAGENEWLARNYAKLGLPARLEPARVVFDKRNGDRHPVEFAGRLSFASTALNPFDASRGLLIYTAADPLGVAAALAYEGPGDYAVLDGPDVLRSGIYEKSWLPWRLK